MEDSSKRNFPYKCFFNEDKREIYAFYRQGEFFNMPLDNIWKPPQSGAHPVGIPIARGETDGAYFHEKVRMPALPAPSRGEASLASTTLSLNTRIVLA